MRESYRIPDRQNFLFIFQIKERKLALCLINTIHSFFFFNVFNIHKEKERIGTALVSPGQLEQYFDIIVCSNCIVLCLSMLHHYQPLLACY